MSLLLIVLLGFAILAALFAVAMLMNAPIVTNLFSGAGGRSQMRRMMSNQRGQNKSGIFSGGADRGGNAAPRGADGRRAMSDEEEKSLRRSNTSQLTLTKRLKFGQWKMTPAIFYVCKLGVSLVLFVIASRFFFLPIQIIVLLFSGHVVMNFLLNRAVDRRFKYFDKDYPAFLLSIVGLVKTGMNPITALETAGQGLEQGSLVRQEVEQMLERLRVGIPEDQAIGSFGEDIYHPEIELFVQALLLSRRVGGTLSDTLERLAKQVRKRQFFRASANAAIGQQRGSVYVIIGLLICIESYLYFSYPDAVVGAIKDPIGWMAWQTAFMVIGLGMFWITQVTKMKI